MSPPQNKIRKKVFKHSTSFYRKDVDTTHDGTAPWYKEYKAAIMRDLHTVLQLFAKEYAMDYCEEFDAIKSVLHYCNENVKQLNKVRFRGGNEDIVNDITNRLQDFWLRKRYIHPSTKRNLENVQHLFRKITMFLLVNTDATYKYNLRDDPMLGHVIEICPLLPKFLLVALMWNLNLDQFFYEALAYTPCWFSFQYFEAASDSLKYIKDPYQVLTKVENLIKAIILSIAKSKEQRFSIVDHKIILGKLNDFTMNLLRQFYTPDAEKFLTFSENEFFKYSGYAINHILDIIIFAFDVHEEKIMLKPSFDAAVFEICAAPSNYNQTSTVETQRLVEEYQLKLISALLNSLQYNVMLVKIDVFLYWVEIDLDSNETLQSVIGGKSYAVGERMRINQSFHHDVANHLTSISIRPKSSNEVIQDSCIGEILCKLDEQLDSQIKKQWLDELLNRSITLGNDECLQSINANIKLISIENCIQIMDYLKMVQCEQLRDEHCSTELVSIILQALQNLSTEDILRLVSYEVKNFGLNVKIFQADNFGKRATEFLNKFSNTFDAHAFLALCFENPNEMWSKIFDVACNSDEHISNFCSIVKLCRPLSNEYFYPLLSKALNDARMRQKFFSQLLCSIYFMLFFDRKTEFFKKFINRNVTEMLELEKYEDLVPLVKSLNLMASNQNQNTLSFGEATAPVLLMAAQVMENARWDLLTYSNERDEIVKGCGTFIIKISTKFLPLATEKDRKWIHKTVKDNYRPLTQYYFQKFSLAPDEPHKKFDEFLIPTEVQDATEAETCLLSIYIRCTSKESEWLARSDRLLHSMPDMMLTLGVVVNETENNDAVINYRNCMANFANIVKKYIIPSLAKDTTKVKQLITKMLKIIEFAPSAIYEEMFLNFEWLLMEVIQQFTLPLEEALSNHVQMTVLKMKECSGRELFLKNLDTIKTEVVK